MSTPVSPYPIARISRETVHTQDVKNLLGFSSNTYTEQKIRLMKLRQFLKWLNRTPAERAELCRQLSMTRAKRQALSNPLLLTPDEQEALLLAYKRPLTVDQFCEDTGLSRAVVKAGMMP